MLLVGVSRLQWSLNRDRDRLGLTRVRALENAPPVLAFTTMALGGFRGLISNALWMRATRPAGRGQVLRDGATGRLDHQARAAFRPGLARAGLEHGLQHLRQVQGLPRPLALGQAGIELLRDDGLRYNPNETLIYRELAWFFQHKIGENLDDANMYYKQQWAKEMAKVFGEGKANLDELINPQTADQTNRARLLIEKYKMDPQFMKDGGRAIRPAGMASAGGPRDLLGRRWGWSGPRRTRPRSSRTI